jgi:uncharacterized protein YndB with AHSA1/START domain
MARVRINGSIHDVWREITRTDDVIPCFFNMRMHYASLQPGSRLSMRSADGRYTGVVGEILEVRPPTRFVHTFRFTSMDDPPCKVIYELREISPGEVEFTLTLEDLTPGSKSAKQMVSGSRLIVNTLKQVIETGKPALGTRALFLVFRAMEPFTPKRCLTSNWQ